MLVLTSARRPGELYVFYQPMSSASREPGTGVVARSERNSVKTRTNRAKPAQRVLAKGSPLAFPASQQGEARGIQHRQESRENRPNNWVRTCYPARLTHPPQCSATWL